MKTFLNTFYLFQIFLLFQMFEVNAQTMKYQLGSFTFNEGNCISVDFAGNSFITGNFQDTAKFGNIQFFNL